MASGWGVVHLCQGGCGQEVQYCGFKLFDAGTDNRHRCPNAYDDQPPRQWIECLCGVDVEIIGETRYERGTTKLHICRLLVRPTVKRSPLRLVAQSNDKLGPIEL